MILSMLSASCLHNFCELFIIDSIGRPTRTRMDAKIYTNDRASLPFAIIRDNKKFAARDVIQRRAFEK